MTNYPSEITDNSRSASLIESTDHLPVNELSATGLSEPKQNWSATEKYALHHSERTVQDDRK